MKNNPTLINSDSVQLFTIFERAVDSMIIINMQGIIERINSAGVKLFGYKKEELLGQKFNLVIPKSDIIYHDLYVKPYEITGQAEIIGTARDVEAQKKDGTIFPCELSINEFFIGDKRKYAGIIHDLTRRKKVEEKILELNEELQKKVKIKSDNLSLTVQELLKSNQLLENEIIERKKVEKALRESELQTRMTLEKERDLNGLKTRFLTMASHEFRTPLSTILSSSGIVEKYIEIGDCSKVGKHFQRITSSVKGLTEMLNDFLSLSEIEEGKIENNPEVFELQDFCKTFFANLKDLLKKDQTITGEIESIKETIFMDKKILQNILLNLISNAIKYSEEGKEISYKIQVLEGKLTIKIIDQGMGIPSSEQKHLFERFYRGSNAINIKGTGLGLNIVKQYIDILNGEIFFDSEERKGTTFTIIIPNVGSFH